MARTREWPRGALERGCSGVRSRGCPGCHRRRGGWTAPFAQLAAHPRAGLAQLLLELRQLGGAVLDELQLAVDVAERLFQELLAALGVDVFATQLRAYNRAGLLGREQRLELVEGD